MYFMHRLTIFMMAFCFIVVCPGSRGRHAAICYLLPDVWDGPCPASHCLICRQTACRWRATRRRGKIQILEEFLSNNVAFVK